MIPNADPEQTDQGKFLIVGFNEDPHYRTSNRTWKLINTETLLIEGTLPFNNDPSYVISLGNNLYFTASFVNNKWIIEMQHAEMGSKVVSETKLLYSFDYDVNLTYFKKQGQNVFLKLNRGDLGTTLYVSNQSLENFYALYESKNYFDFPVMNESFLVIKSNQELKLIEISEDLNMITTSDVAKDFLDKVTYAEITNERVVVLENRLKVKEIGLAEMKTLIKTKSDSPIESTTTATKFQDISLTSTSSLEEGIDSIPVENFPKLKHMLPHYWFLATGSSENLFSIGAMTQFSDPMDLNILNVSALTYPSVNKYGGSVNYFHKFSTISDQWVATASYNKEYSKTQFSEKLNDTAETTFGSYYQVLLQRWVVVPGVFFGQSKVNDFLSRSKIDKVGVSAVVIYEANSFDDYFQKLHFQTRLGHDKPKAFESYINSQSKLLAQARFNERLVGGIQTAYSKLLKENIRGGTTYGGGTTDISNIRWHEFYGLPYSNAYGNEIFNFRLHLDWNFWNVYRGSGFVPVFLKEAHLVVGREMLTADRIFLAGKRFDNKMIQSFFAGPVLKTNLFYYVPTDIEMIFSTIKRPDSGSVNQVELNIKVSSF